MSLQGRVMAAINAWRTYGKAEQQSRDAQDARYALLGALYTGTWRADPRWPWAKVNPDVYRNSRQIVKQTSAIIDLYEQLVYQGDLSTDGKPLPDGTRGAIPIDPQTGSETANQALLQAFHQGFALWQWRMFMSLVPKTAAIFGDVLVELDDDYERGVVMPNIVYPGYVPDADLDLDLAGNVKRYAIEYQVTVAASTAFGRTVQAESYRFRKEVDGQWFRYYRDGKSFDYGKGEIHENPYGFVPACLFRHELVVGSNRGMGAFEKTMMQAMDLNSTLSSATDYQRKQFGAPIGVKGSALSGRAGRTLTMPGGVKLTASTTEEEFDEARRAAAERLDLLPMSDQGEFVTIQFDVGQTMAMVEFIHQGLISENPEAEWASKLFGLTQATGPGMQRILSPIIGKVETVRKIEDPQMIKLCQMNTAIMGHRLNNGDIPEGIVRARPDRYEAFRPFDLDSYGKGMLDATIPTRDVFPESRAEKAVWLSVADALESEWAMREIGMPDEEIAKRLADKEQARREMAAAFSVAGAGEGSQESGDEESRPQAARSGVRP